MGIVYEAWDPQLKRRLAVKRLRAGLDSSLEELRRIRMEAEVIAKIRHNNIVQIFEVGEADGLPYLAMEYCEGGSLASRLGGIPLPPKRAAEFVKQIAVGVAAAHACRIIHRDLKPANVLLEHVDTWVPKVTDFGLAKQLDNVATATAAGSILGTPAYMSPEQAFGNAAAIDVTSDVYSIGAILYECLTGLPPFRGVTVADTLDQVRKREPVSVRQLQPRVPIDVETISLKCLRKDPAQRYQTVQALVDDLSCFLERRPIQARRETSLEAAIRVGRKYPMASTLAITSALLLLTIAIGSTIFASRLSTSLKESQQAARTARLEQANALVGRAHGIRSSKQPGQRLEALAAIREAQEIGRSLNQPPEWFEPLRDEAIAALLLPDACISEFREEADVVQYSDFSDDHRLYAFSFPSGNITVRGMVDHVEVASLPRIDELAGLIFVGADHLLQVGYQTGKFEKWNVGVSPPRRVWQRPSGFQFAALAPDQQTMAVCDAKEIQIVRLADGAVIHRLDPKPYFRETRLTLHPTHPYLCLYSYFEAGIEIRNWETGETLTRFEPTDIVDNNFSGAAWSPDGRHFALMSGHGLALRWFEFDPEPASLKLQRTQSPAGFAQGGLTYNARGDRIWRNGWSNMVEILDSNHGDHLVTSIQYFGTYFAGYPKRDPLGEFAGFFRSLDHPKRVGMMRIADHSESNLLVPSSEDFGAAAFDPDERFVVVRKKDSLLFICPSSRRVLLELQFKNLRLFSFSFAGRDQLIVNAYDGCFRWPYQYDKETNRVELGIPQRIMIPSGAGSVTASRDGKTVACGVWTGYGTQDYAGIWIKTENEPAARKVVGQVSGIATCVSSDGKWVVGTHDETSIFDGRNPAIVLHNVKSQGKTCFSDDGTLLVAGGKLIKTANWETVDRIGEGLIDQLTPDGKLILSYLQSHVDVLSDAASGHVFARVPGGDSGSSVLSPHSNFLLNLAEDGYRVTDLRAIREGILNLGLAWDGPDYDQHEKVKPLESMNVVTELQGVDSAAKLFQLMDTTALKRLESSPNDGQAEFDVAMVRVKDRDLEDAIKHLNRTCELLPQSITAKQWRAYVLAELKRWSEAIADADWVLQQIDETDFRLLRAEWLIRNGDIERAIEDCTHVIENKTHLVTWACGLRGHCYEQSGDSFAANADQKIFYERLSQDDETLNLTAFPMVGPDLSLRHPVLAQLVVERLQEIQSEFSLEIRDTIALTLYRNDRCEDCLVALKGNLADPAEYCYPYALVTAAMCEAKLGDLDAAQQHLQHAKSWNGKFSSYIEQCDFDMLFAEASRLMGGLNPAD